MLNALFFRREFHRNLCMYQKNFQYVHEVTQKKIQFTFSGWINALKCSIWCNSCVFKINAKENVWIFHLNIYGDPEILMTLEIFSKIEFRRNLNWFWNLQFLIIDESIKKNWKCEKRLGKLYEFWLMIFEILIKTEFRVNWI